MRASISERAEIEHRPPVGDRCSMGGSGRRRVGRSGDRGSAEEAEAVEEIPGTAEDVGQCAEEVDEACEVGDHGVSRAVGGTVRPSDAGTRSVISGSGEPLVRARCRGDEPSTERCEATSGRWWAQMGEITSRCAQ